MFVVEFATLVLLARPAKRVFVDSIITFVRPLAGKRGRYEVEHGLLAHCGQHGSGRLRPSPEHGRPQEGGYL